jgi:hypothetical protein
MSVWRVDYKQIGPLPKWADCEQDLQDFVHGVLCLCEDEASAWFLQRLMNNKEYSVVSQHFPDLHLPRLITHGPGVFRFNHFEQPVYKSLGFSITSKEHGTPSSNQAEDKEDRPVQDTGR